MKGDEVEVRVPRWQLPLLPCLGLILPRIVPSSLAAGTADKSVSKEVSIWLRYLPTHALCIVTTIYPTLGEQRSILADARALSILIHPYHYLTPMAMQIRTFSTFHPISSNAKP